MGATIPTVIETDGILPLLSFAELEGNRLRRIMRTRWMSKSILIDSYRTGSEMIDDTSINMNDKLSLKTIQPNTLNKSRRRTVLNSTNFFTYINFKNWISNSLLEFKCRKADLFDFIVFVNTIDFSSIVIFRLRSFYSCPIYKRFKCTFSFTDFAKKIKFCLIGSEKRKCVFSVFSGY